MRAAILAVGSELLGIDRLDTNSLRLTEALRSYGVELVEKSVLGDSQQAIRSWLQDQLQRVELVLICGGLGPTRDDLTRDAVAAALGRSLQENADIAADIESKFASMGLDMPPVNLRQARIIEGAEVLHNPRGTAPGMHLEHEDTDVFLFPGVPGELDEMIDRYLIPWLVRSRGAVRIESRSLRVACRSESAVEEILQPLYETFDPSAITVLASPGDIEVRFTASGSERERTARLQEMVEAARYRLGGSVYADSREATLETVVGEQLRQRGQTVTTAESCTAGLLAERLTRQAGSSAYFLGGIVTYSDGAKIETLGVPAELVSRHGAVSEDVARSMAAAVRRLFSSDYGIGITGIAGPGGGSAEKPVGTVHLAVAGPDSESAMQHRLLRLPGDRLRVRQLSTQWALETLRRLLTAP